MKPDRREIMRDAWRRYNKRLREGGELVLSWPEALRRAWAAWRQRHPASIEKKMAEIAAGVRAFRPLLYPVTL